MVKRLSIMVGVLALVVTNVHAASSQVEPTEQMRTLVSKATGNKGIIKAAFTGPANMTGLVVGNTKTPEMPNLLAWVTPDQQHLMFGTLSDKNGRDLSTVAGEKYKAINILTMLKETCGIGKQASIQEGGRKVEKSKVTLADAYAQISQIGERNGVPHPGLNGSKKIYVFFDTSCAHCHDSMSLVNKSIEELNSKDISVVWIPVSRSGELEPIRNGARMLEKPEDIIGQISNNPKYVLAKSDSLAGEMYLSRVEENTEKFRSLGIGGTPTVFYMSKDGPRFNPGLSKRDLEAVISNI